MVLQVGEALDSDHNTNHVPTIGTSLFPRRGRRRSKYAGGAKAVYRRTIVAAGPRSLPYCTPHPEQPRIRLQCHPDHQPRPAQPRTLQQFRERADSPWPSAEGTLQMAAFLPRAIFLSAGVSEEAALPLPAWLRDR